MNEFNPILHVLRIHNLPANLATLARFADCDSHTFSDLVSDFCRKPRKEGVSDGYINIAFKHFVIDHLRRARVLARRERKAGTGYRATQKAYLTEDDLITRIDGHKAKMEVTASNLLESDTAEGKWARIIAGIEPSRVDDKYILPGGDVVSRATFFRRRQEAINRLRELVK